MEALKKQLADERKTYQQQFPALVPDDSVAAAGGEDMEVSVEQVTKALNFECVWGKYKGSSYREIYIRDPAYFQRTVLGNLSRINNQSFSYRALSTLSNTKKSNSVENQGLIQKENVEPLDPPLEPLSLKRTSSRANFQLATKK